MNRPFDYVGKKPESFADLAARKQALELFAPREEMIVFNNDAAKMNFIKLMMDRYKPSVFDLATRGLFASIGGPILWVHCDLCPPGKIMHIKDQTLIAQLKRTGEKYPRPLIRSRLSLRKTFPIKTRAWRTAAIEATK